MGTKEIRAQRRKSNDSSKRAPESPNLSVSSFEARIGERDQVGGQRLQIQLQDLRNTLGAQSQEHFGNVRNMRRHAPASPELLEQWRHQDEERAPGSGNQNIRVTVPVIRVRPSPADPLVTNVKVKVGERRWQ